MEWSEGELHKVEYGMVRKRRGKDTHYKGWHERMVLVPYARLIQQFLLEESYAALVDSHEAQRRVCYVGRVLDEFAKELMGYRGDDTDFRSNVLTPILQRQLRGIPDAYGPTIQRAVHLPDVSRGPVTIAQATRFYLGIDPTSPKCIPTYRRNLIYIREARWHLAIMLGLIVISKARDFNWYLDHHDLVMSELGPKPAGPGIPAFSETEVKVIVVESLTEWFERELRKTVSPHINCLAGRCLTI